VRNERCETVAQRNGTEYVDDGGLASWGTAPPPPFVVTQLRASWRESGSAK